jgi:hypothetical protein
VTTQKIKPHLSGRTTPRVSSALDLPQPQDDQTDLEVTQLSVQIHRKIFQHIQ